MGFIVKAAAAPFKLYNAISDEVAKERRLRLTDGLAWATFLGRESKAGKTVTLETALQLATIWACVKLTSQAVSSLPIAIYEKRADDSRERVDDELAEVIGDSPNEDQTSLEFWETIVAWLLTRGNAYAEKVMTGRRVTALLPIPSTHCRPVRRSDGTLVYRVNDRGRAEDLPRERVFHVKGFGFGDDVGLSPISFGVQTFGSAIATDEAAAKMFANGVQTSGFLSSDTTLTKEQREAFRNNLEKFKGSDNAGKLMVLEAGLKYQALTLNPEDAQMLETRRFHIEEMCRWFGMPPIIIGHAAQGQTMWGTGVEAILTSWLTLGIDPICDRIEARIKKQLIRPAGNRRRYAEFNREALLQMDSTAKANFLSTMVQNALMTRNEGRQKLNLPRDDSPVADKLTAQTNLAPLDRLGQAPEQNLRQALRDFIGVTDNRPVQDGDRQ